MRATRSICLVALALVGIGLASSPTLAEEDERKRGWMGVHAGELEAIAAAEIGYPGKGGVAIVRVLPGGPAAKAGLEDRDVLLMIRDKEIDNFEILHKVLSDTVVGERVNCRVWRKGEVVALTLQLGSRPRELDAGQGEREQGARERRRAEDRIAELKEAIVASAKEGQKDGVRKLLASLMEVSHHAFRLEDHEQKQAPKDAAAAAEREKERAAARRELSILRLAFKAFREAAKPDAADLVEHAIHARELRLEGARGDDAARIYETEPKRAQVGELLAQAAKLWTEYGHEEKSAATAALASVYLERARAGQRRRHADVNNRIEAIERQIRELSAALKKLVGEVEGICREER